MLGVLRRRAASSSQVHAVFTNSYKHGTDIRGCLKSLYAIRLLSSRGGAPSISAQLISESHLKERMNSAVVRASPRDRAREEEMDSLLKDIYNAKSAGRLVERLENVNFGRLDDRDINVLFSAMFKAVRYETCDDTKKELLNSIGMQKLFKVVKQYCRWLNVTEIITVVKFMAFLNVSGSHPTLQTLLRLISKQANTLTLSDIIYVSFLLEKLGTSPIVTALQLALPVIFESHLNCKLDISEPGQVCDALHYSVQKNLGDEILQKIIDTLIPHVKDLSSKQAMSAVWSLSETRRKLLRVDAIVVPSLQILCNSFDSFPLAHIGTTLSKVAKKYSRTAPYFYNEDLVAKFCQILATSESEKDVDVILYSLKSISQLRHVDVAYLDRVSEIVLSNPSLVLNNDYIFAIVLRGLSSANYKPDTWDKLEPILSNHPVLTKIKEMGTSSLTTALDFLILGSFPSRLIEGIFSPNNFRMLEQYVEMSSPYIPLLIIKSIKILYPEYKGPLPPSETVEEWKKSVLKIPKTYPLRGALQSGIGGDKYVMTGIFSEGFHIDHCIAFRKGGYPVSLDVTEPVLLEEVQVPTDSNIVMVKALMPESFANNTNRLRGIYALELKLIESLGYTVIAIDTARWSEFPDSEKIPFLMYKIREKIDVSSER